MVPLSSDIESTGLVELKRIDACEVSADGSLLLTWKTGAFFWDESRRTHIATRIGSRLLQRGAVSGNLLRGVYVASAGYSTIKA